MIKNIRIEKYPKIQLIKTKRWKRTFIHLMEYIIEIHYKLDLFKKTKKYLLYLYLRYISPIAIWYLKKKHGNIEPIMYAEFMHTVMKNNWKEVKKYNSKKRSDFSISDIDYL